MIKKVLLVAVLCCVIFCMCAPTLALADEEVAVYLGGTPLGLKLVSDGMVVAGFAPVNGLLSPAKQSGLCIGDVLVKVQDVPVHTRYDVQRALDQATGPVTLSLVRQGNPISLSLYPALGADGHPLLGVYLQPGLEGLGTLTYVRLDTLQYGALGHGVEQNGALASLYDGAVYAATITSVVKGQQDKAGELVGNITSLSLGNLVANTPYGVFGEADSNRYASRPSVRTLPRSKVAKGDAVVVCTVGGADPAYYAATITEVRRGDDVKSFTIRITDPRLLAATGGIVQGMSGSPVLQEGRWVGAVTHVTLEDSALGYGIFVDAMFAASPQEGAFRHPAPWPTYLFASLA